MAQNIVKVIKAKRPLKEFKRILEELPEVKQSERLPKDLNSKEEKRKSDRFGHLSVGYYPDRKPKQEANGSKIK